VKAASLRTRVRRVNRRRDEPADTVLARRTPAGGLQKRKAGADGMAQGTVNWFSDEKGYGFISPDDGSEDLFVHYTGIEGPGFKTLEEGASVTFETSQGKKGLQAINVTPA
jgi:CspA family cold shock protein